MSGTRASATRDPGRPEQRAAFLAGAVGHVLREGVATLALRPLAAALGTSDRMLLYYFGSREQLLTAVLTAVGERLQAQLDEVLPGGPASPSTLLAGVWEAMQAPDVEPILRLYLEVSGLAAQGREPFRTVAQAVAQGWLGWVEARIEVPDGDPRAAASAVLALVDGLLLVRFVASAQIAAQAAGWLGEHLGADGGSTAATGDQGVG